MNQQIKRVIVGMILIIPTICVNGQNTPFEEDSIGTNKVLQEVEVRGFGAERNLKSTEMGRISLSNEAISKMPVMFGEPDIVKALQTQPGVSQGVEGFTGLYVRGGDDDQNLFLYQGLPLYHVSHLGGIFSSFNVPTISRVDFYKAAFPAQYGGRISSITDVAMKRSDSEEFHGRVSVGLLSANAFLSGPIVKGRTAYSVGLRRSWIDIFSTPALAILNAIQKKKGKKQIAGYNFTDFNLRLDHRFNSRLSAYVIGYYGHDNLKIGLREFENTTGGEINADGSEITRFFDEESNKLSWGNWGVLGAFDYKLGCGTWNTSVYYSKYSSTYHQSREYQSDMTDASTYGYNKSRTKNGIADIGVKTKYLADFSDVYKLRVGVEYVNHDYLPEGILNQMYDDEVTSEETNNSPHLRTNEFAAYIDNTINIKDVFALSAGLRGNVLRINSTTFSYLEPRVSMKMGIGSGYSVKASYARMHQCVQQISNNYISLPTDLWQPITDAQKPIESDQFSVGVYGNLPLDMYFSVEGWYKKMSNLLEYKEGVSALNTGLSWSEKLTAGRGWSYGVDVSVSKEVGKITGTFGYGLLWNWRKFDELNQGKKFPAKFDNRHKVNINAAYKLNEKIEFNAGWTYMTGNRLTLSMYNYDIPGSQFPNAPNVGPPGYGNEMDGIDYYPSRNNVRMPAYHRLDLSMNINKNLKNGKKGIWSFGLYNAYCRMNALTIKKDNENDIIFHPNKDKWHRAFKTLSLIPVIPSVSYTYIF